MIKAPEDSPDFSANQPAFLPIVSITKTLLCEPAVVLNLSTMSVITSTAVSNPNV